MQKTFAYIKRAFCDKILRIVHKQNIEKRIFLNKFS